ncbi:DUF1835 domain-containing protein [Bacillus licheniformis]|nr:DUF1835 domain-containing protein [Bacillus licheniformis]
MVREQFRVWEDGRIKSVKEDFFDSFIIEKLAQLQKNRSANTFINCLSLIGEVIGHLEENIGDEFIEYRILELILRQMNLAVFHLNTTKFFPHTRSSGELNDENLRFIYEQGDQAAVTAAEGRRLAEEWTALSQQTSVLEAKEGRVNRYEWLKTYLNDRFHESGKRYSRFEVAVSALSGIPEQASVFIWTGDHAHEQTGLRFVHHRASR